MEDRGRFSYKELLQTIERAQGTPASNRIKRTLQLALVGHQGQVRESRDPNESIPFIVHPVGTACLAMKHYPSCHNMPDDLETVICVALVHDLLEDTYIDINQIRKATDSKVQAYAEALAKPSAGIAKRSAAERNREYLDKIAHAGPTAVFVKICDSIHNLSRLSTAPLYLIPKLIDKAQSQYMPLLARCELGGALSEVYQAAIQTAKQQFAQEEQ